MGDIYIDCSKLTNKASEEAPKLKCGVCGKEVDENSSFVCCSSFGAITNRYCKKCWENKLEPYDQMVDSIAMAGYFPEEIRPEVVAQVRAILKALNKPEEQFIEDVNGRILDFNDMFEMLSSATYEELYDDFNLEELDSDC